MEIMIDANAAVAIIIDEPEKETVLRLTRGLIMVAPDMMPYEVANALSKMIKKKTIDREGVMNAFDRYKEMPIKSVGIKFEGALEISWEYKMYSYDACYLEAAKRLNLPLLTFDRKMTDVGKRLGITILGGKYDGN